eukprot:m.53654 g.53654  ORF g.53654 m.53654 type:complete len:54 (+) comp12814_c2_seq2:594-755(+)
MNRQDEKGDEERYREGHALRLCSIVKSSSTIDICIVPQRCSLPQARGSISTVG